MKHILSEKKLSESVGQKSENLHLMRFVAALMVILSHAFIISTGTQKGEWFIELTNVQLSMGNFAVAIFFLCGGYLISMSMEKSKTAVKYFEARIIRLIPPLFFVVFLLIMAGGLFTTLPAAQYYTSAGTWKYLLNSVFLLVHNLPGVFENNPYLPTVNGALWTLPVEFLCYVLCFIAYKLGFMNKKRFLISVPLVIVGTIAMIWLSTRIPAVGEVIRPVLLFYIGMGYWIYREQITLKLNYFGIAVIAFFLLFALNLGNIAMLFCFPYIMMTLWFGFGQCSSKIGKLGNYSYGIYLWGFPVQQAVVYLWGNTMNPYVNTLISIPIAMVLGIITYEITEKRFIKFYKKIRK